MVKIEQPHDVFIYFWLSRIKDYTPLLVLILYYSLCNMHLLEHVFYVYMQALSGDFQHACGKVHT